ncbi:MAG: hypothetical protein NT051_01150, partial [Candidatus Micrarchaeota archaeon]|nr:hypothetical protein [Candidatus Micrarchaeota archaeon]
MRTEKEAHNFFGTFKGLKAQAALESNCDSTDLSTHRQMVHSNCCSSRTARPLHAQAALEYLITYGWALLVIVIVIAALVVINPISTPASCSFPTGFNCPNIPAIDTNGSLYVRVVNSNNNEITVLRAICTEDKSMTPPNPSIGATPSQILVARQSML